MKANHKQVMVFVPNTVSPAHTEKILCFFFMILIVIVFLIDVYVGLSGESDKQNGEQ